MADPVARFCLRCGAPLSLAEHGGKSRLSCAREGCGFVFWDNPLPVVAAIVEHEGDVILVRAKGWPEKMYGLVTGFLERDETPAEGVLRELREELGLDGEIARLVGLSPFPMRNELIIAYHVRASGAVRVGDELEDIKRVSPAKLRPWPFGTGLAVAEWLKERSS